MFNSLIGSFLFALLGPFVLSPALLSTRLSITSLRLSRIALRFCISYVLTQQALGTPFWRLEYPSRQILCFSPSREVLALADNRRRDSLDATRHYDTTAQRNPASMHVELLVYLEERRNVEFGIERKEAQVERQLRAIKL